MTHNAMPPQHAPVGMKRNLSAFAVWGLSFGYAVGWGAFVMPGAAFLPDAGPLGTLVGVVIGAAVMAVIGWNYHKMSSAYPGPAGACSYAHEAFGADYGFLTAWSLSLAYMAILWANATALVLLSRYMFGDVLQFGWHDTMAGFDIYLGEVLLSVAVMVLAGGVCLYGRRLAGRVQAALASFMLVGVAAVFFAALLRHGGGTAALAPAFAPGGGSRVTQILRILAMMPWAFVGFEAVSHSSGEFRFPAKRLWWVLLAAIAASVAMYSMLAVLPVLSHPEEYATWTEYLGARVGLSGLDSMPTFAAARVALGGGGVALVGAAMFAGIFTGIVAATVAMSRLLYSLAANDVLPRAGWLGRLDSNGSPRNAILFTVGISLVIPFFGRTVIGWPVDVSSIGAAVAYCVTSAAAFKFACRNGDVVTKATGLVGAVMSIVFCLLLLVPNYLAGSVLSAESYLVLALWCIIGFALYRSVFKHDRFQRFGRSPVVWTGIVILIFFSSLMWVRLSSQDATGRTVNAIVAFQERHCALHHGASDVKALHHEQGFVTDEMEKLNDEQLGHDIVQMTLLAFSLIIIFNLYAIQRRRQEELEPTPMDLGTVLREVGDVFSAQMSEKGIRFSIDTSGLVHRHVLCDRNRFNRILLNLISNAWKFTQSGGSVTVAMTEVATSGEGKYELRVKDTGLGMSREFLKRVFDPFERERVSAMNGVEGTGLGMPITKGIVTLMGGTIDVESERGQGTEFVVRLALPVVEASAVADNRRSPLQNASAKRPSDPVDPSGKTRRILLVEDNDINREIAYTLLSQSGFSVDQAEDGKAAVVKFEHGGPGCYDAILMDVHMPVMNGYSAARAIRALEAPGGPHVPIIAVSANAFESDVREALASGMDAHIAKPIKLAALLKTLEGLAGSRREIEEPAGDPLASLARMGCNVEAALREIYVGNRAFYLKMLGKLAKNTALGKMRDALGAGNVAVLFSSSHNLKGVYASLGLTPLHALCSEIVEIARAGGLDGAAERLERLEKMHGEVLDVIESKHFQATLPIP